MLNDVNVNSKKFVEFKLNCINITVNYFEENKEVEKKNNLHA